MTFVYPSFLWALAAVAVPVIIHLFNFTRYKKLYFTNVKFLRELQEESKSRSRLRELLVLLARCLAIACLVLAFCQPIIPTGESKVNQAGAHAVSLYIDNSLSTQNINSRGPVFDVARQKAREVIKAYSSADRFQIVTNDFEGRHQRFMTREDALSALEELKPSASVKMLDQVVKRQTSFLSTSIAPNKKIYIFSDAQRSTFNLPELKPDTLIKATLVPVLANELNNVFVDSCWFETPIQQVGFIQNLHARIRNSGKKRLDVGSARLYLNKVQIALASFSVEANSFAEVKFRFECKTSGFNFGSIKIEDYPVTFDDELNFAFNSRVNITAGLINGRNIKGNQDIHSLFKADTVFNLLSCSEETIDYSIFKTSDVLVLNQLSDYSSGLVSELEKFTRQGGAIVILPPISGNLGSCNSFLAGLNMPAFGLPDTAKINTGKIEMASGFYEGVFEKKDERMNLPRVLKHYQLNKNNASNFETIITLQNGDDFFGFGKHNDCLIYLFASPMEEEAGNFNKHAMFVPTFYKICFGAVKMQPLFYTVSSNVMVTIKKDDLMGEQPPHIKQINGKTDIIPEFKTVNNSLMLFTRGQVSEPGFYEVNYGGKSLLPLAFNNWRLESALESYSMSELTEILEKIEFKNITLIDDTESDISGQVLETEGGKKLWKLFILLALGFILAETALLRFLK